MEHWMKLCKQQEQNAFYFLIGNKNDKEDLREVERTEAQEFALQNKMVYLESSVQKNINTSEIFHGISLKIVQEIQRN